MDGTRISKFPYFSENKASPKSVIPSTLTKADELAKQQKDHKKDQSNMIRGKTMRNEKDV